MKVLLTLVIIVFSLIVVAVLGNESKCSKTRQKRNVNYNNRPYPSGYNENNNNYNYNYNKKNKPVVCKPSLACANISSIATVDVTWMTKARLYYSIAQGCYASTNMANIFLNRPVKTELELDQMCLTFWVNQTIEHQSGYGKQIIMACNFLENGGRNCVAAPVNTDSIDVGSFESAQCAPVATDGESFSIYIRCQNNKQDILLLSTNPYVEEMAFRMLLDVADTSGFPVSEIRVPACYYPTYPNPLEDYLQNSGPYRPNSCNSPYTASALFSLQSSYH